MIGNRFISLLVLWGSFIIFGYGWSWTIVHCRTTKAEEERAIPIAQLGDSAALTHTDPLGLPQFLDDGGSGFVAVGDWVEDTLAGYESDHLTHAAGSGAETATWTFSGLTPGYEYTVAASWTAESGRSAAATYQIVDTLNGETSRTLAAVSVDQQLGPDDFTDAGAVWETLGEGYLLRGTTLSIQLSAAADGTVAADAIRLQRTGSWQAPTGISAPSFGIEQSHWMYAEASYQYDYGSGPEAYRIGPDGPYTHYIDPTHAAATDQDNPFGTPDQPRVTFPTALSAGSVVELHGGPYTAYKWYLTAEGTAEAPVFFRGGNQTDKPVLDGTIVVEAGQYVIFENLLVQGHHRGITLASSSGALHHAAVRHCELAGTAALDDGACIAISGGSSAPREDIVVYNNHIHHQGDSEADTEIDRHAVNIIQYATDVWVVDNHLHHSQGDSFQVGHNGNFTAHDLYIGRNLMHDDRENAVDIKEADDVIISQNTMYGYDITGSHSHGSVVSVHYGPENVWLLNNHIYDGVTGIIDADGLTSMYVLGNVIHDVEVGLKSWNSATRHVVGNTITNVDRGISQESSALCHVLNNLITDVSASGYHIYVKNGSSQMDYNLLYQSDGSVRIAWAGGVYTDLSTFQSATGKGLGSLEADPQFINAAEGDFHLQPGSDAVDAAGDIHYYVGLYYSLYGVDIRQDADGGQRLLGQAIDMGAFEAEGDPPVVNNTAPVAQSLIVVTDEDLPVNDLVMAQDADEDALLFFVFDPPTYGNVSMSADGSFVYSPQPNWYGTDSFVFRAYDGWDFSAPAVVTVDVISVEDAPTAVGDVGTTNGYASVTVEVLANDYDVDGDPVSLTAFTDPMYGEITDNGGGSFTYTPGVSFLDSDFFGYTITDGKDNNTDGTVNITYLPSPWLSQDIGDLVATGHAGYSISTDIYSISGGGSDISGIADAFHYVTQPTNGSVAIFARVLHVASTYPWAKAGLMIRQDLEANAANALVPDFPDENHSLCIMRRRLTA